MIYERIDIDWIYTHLLWAYVFLIYIVTVIAFLLHGFAKKGRK